MDQRQAINRFVEFFLIEQRLKWKVYMTSGGVALTWALVRLLVSHKSEEEVSVEATVLLCLLVAISVVAYVAKGSTFLKKSQRPGPSLSLSLRFAGAAAVMLLMFMGSSRPAEMQAAIVNFRLKSFAEFLTVKAASVSDQQLQARFQKIESIVGASSTNQIPVDLGILQRTQGAISDSLKQRPFSNQTKQLGWTAAIDLQSFAYTRKVQAGLIFPRPIAPTAAYVVNSAVSFENTSLYLRGEHSAIALGSGGGQFIFERSDVVFDQLDFLGSTDLYPIEADTSSNVLVRDSVIKNVTQDLARITWVDVRFENSRILYTEGSPLRLRGVSFKDCDLSKLWGFLGPLNRELEKRIREANGQPITFIYEPQ